MNDNDFLSFENVSRVFLTDVYGIYETATLSGEME